MSNCTLTGVLFEAHNLGVDIEGLTKKVCAGLMGAEMYAPSGAAQKPKECESLRVALSEALKLVEMKAELKGQ